MMYPFLILPANGGSFCINSLLRLMASLISVIVSSSTLPLPLILLLTLLGLMPFPFSTPQLVSLARSPSRTFLPTLLVVPLPSAKCFPFHAGHHLPHHVSLMAFYRLSFLPCLQFASAGLALLAALLTHLDDSPLYCLLCLHCLHHLSEFLINRIEYVSHDITSTGNYLPNPNWI